MWSSALLGEVCEIIKRGITPKYLDEGGMCVLNQKCVRDHSIDFKLARRHDVEQKRVPEERIIQMGDVLVNSTGVGTLGRVAQLRTETEEPTTVDSHVTIVRPRVGLFHLEFFGYALIRIEDEIAASGQGLGGQTELARKKLAEAFQINFPRSLPEQERIVAILDEAFAAIATATANTEKNLANARELFDGGLNKAFEREKPMWPSRRFGELCNFVRGPFGGSLKKSCFVESGYCVYEQQHAINDQFEQVRYFVDEKKFNEMARFELRPGDLIMSCSGTMGRVAIAPVNLRRGIINQALLKLSPSSGLSSGFLKLWMQSADFQEQIAEQSKGVAIKNVASVKVLKEIAAPLPPIEEQTSLVSQLSELESATEGLSELYHQKAAAISELRQSILHKAFMGELAANPSSTERALSEAGV